MFFPPFSFDPFCGALVDAIRQANSAYFTAFNFFDPFKLVRVSSQLQRNFFQVTLP